MFKVEDAGGVAGNPVVTFGERVLARSREEIDQAMVELVKLRPQLAGSDRPTMALEIGALVSTLYLGPPTMSLGGGSLLEEQVQDRWKQAVTVRWELLRMLLGLSPEEVQLLELLGAQFGLAPMAVVGIPGGWSVQATSAARS